MLMNFLFKWETYTCWWQNCYTLCDFYRLVTKYHILGGLNSRNLFSHNSSDYKVKIKVLIGLVSSEASPLGLQMAGCLLPVSKQGLSSV